MVKSYHGDRSNLAVAKSHVVTLLPILLGRKTNSLGEILYFDNGGNGMLIENGGYTVNICKDEAFTVDSTDHAKTISIIPQHNTEETVMSIAKEYLPRIGGYGHTWTCILNGDKCATIEGNCANITSISDASFFATNEMRFDYHAAAY